MATCRECNGPVVLEGGAYKDRYYEMVRDGAVVAYEHAECRYKAAVREFQRSGRLTSYLTLENALRTHRRGLHVRDVDDDIADAMARLDGDVKRFNIEAWFGGVDSVHADTKYEGRVVTYPRTTKSFQHVVEGNPHFCASATIGDVVVLIQTMAGRALVEFEGEEHRITLITATGEQTSRMGIQGIDGTEGVCRRMINIVRRGWRDLRFDAYKKGG